MSCRHSCESTKCVKCSLKVGKNLCVKQNLCVKGDAQINGSLSVQGSITTPTITVDKIQLTDNGCQEEVVTRSTHPLVGWWLNTNKGTLTDTITLWNIRCEEGKFFAHLYAGYQGRYREWTPEDFSANAAGVWGIVQATTFGTNDFPLVPIPGNSKGFYCNPTLPDDPDFLSTQQVIAAELQISDDPNVSYVYMINTNNGIGFAIMDLTLRLVKLDYVPVIEKYNDSYIDNTNPVKIFENIFKNMTMIGNSQFSKESNSSDFPGWAPLNERYQQLLTTGVSYTSEVKDVWRTRVDRPTTYAFPLSTTLITKTVPYPRIGARAYVSGFKAPYDILNNTTTGWELGLADNNNARNGSTVYGLDYYDGAHETFLLTLLDVITTDLPVYDPALHGEGHVEVRVKPVTPGCKYSELVAAVHDLYGFSERSTHSLFYPFFDRRTLRLYQTFEDIQAGILANNARRFTFRTRGYQVTRTSDLYTNLFSNNPFTAHAIPSNDPTGMNLNEAKFRYSIDLGNYLDPAHTYNIYWGLTGPEIPGSPVTGPKLVTMSDGYYKTPGSKFVFMASNFYDAPPDPAFWSIYGDYKQNLIFGLMNANKTCGRKVGYLYIETEFSFDPSFAASLFQDFTPPGVPVPLGPVADSWAVMMRKFNELQVEDIIIDIRGNGGGADFVDMSLAMFFGGNRPGFAYAQSFAGNGFRPNEKLQDIQNQAHFLELQNLIDNSAIINTDLWAQLYPDCMFRGEGKRVVFLTDSNAASIADAFPHYFRNSSGNPNDLGHGVTSILIGDIDGRVCGGGGNLINLFTNVGSNLFNFGAAASAIWTTLESTSNLISLGDKPAYMCNQLPAIKPNVLLNGDIAATFWLDTGYKGVYPKNPVDGGSDPLVLPLSTGVTQPDKNTPTTWRDRWLEACIMSLGLCNPSYQRVDESFDHLPKLKTIMNNYTSKKENVYSRVFLS